MAIMALCTTKGGVWKPAKMTSLVEDIRYTGIGGYETLAKCIASVLQEKNLLGSRIGLELGVLGISCISTMRNQHGRCLKN